MLTLLLLACATPEPEAEACEAGFGMAEDGNCYPLATEEEATYKEVACGGDNSHYTPVDMGGIEVEPDMVQAWGYVDDFVIDICRDYPAEMGEMCAYVPLTEGWVSDQQGMTVTDGGGVSVRCHYFSFDGGAAGPIASFVYTPIRIYITE